MGSPAATLGSSNSPSCAPALQRSVDSSPRVRVHRHSPLHGWPLESKRIGPNWKKKRFWEFRVFFLDKYIYIGDIQAGFRAIVPFCQTGVFKRKPRKARNRRVGSSYQDVFFFVLGYPVLLTSHINPAILVLNVQHGLSLARVLETNWNEVRKDSLIWNSLIMAFKLLVNSG